MITFLSKFFIKEKEDKGKIRQEYGILCGMVGIFLNILLFRLATDGSNMYRD